MILSIKSTESETKGPIYFALIVTMKIYLFFSWIDTGANLSLYSILS